MTTANAAKKLSKLTNQEVMVNQNGLRYVKHNGHYICFYNNGRDEVGSMATCFHTSRENSDYVTYHDNITQAFKFVNRR
jgi:hypothetical protein